MGRESVKVIEVRGKKPSRILILHEPYNKPGRIFTRWREDSTGWLRYGGHRFILDVQIGSDNPTGKAHAAATPGEL